MFDTDPTPQHPADEAPDPAVLRAERRLRMLEELAEIGMEMARALRSGVAAATEPVAGGENAAAKAPDEASIDAFGRISRAIRLTLSLEAKTDTYLRNLKAGIVLEREVEKAEASKKAWFDIGRRADRIRELVLSAAEAEIPDFESFHDLDEALEQRLTEDDAYVNADQRPLRETVERLCHDLMLNPDWSRWSGDGWIEPEGPPARGRYSAFHRPSRTPIDTDEPAPPDTAAPIQPWRPSYALE